MTQTIPIFNMDNYNYPMGADTSDAPWNQPDFEPMPVNVKLTVTLKNELRIETINYTEEQWEDYDIGDEGETLHYGGVDRTFDASGFPNEYSQQYIEIPELLNMLAKYVDKDDKITKYQREKIIESCKGWSVDYVEVEDWEETT